MAIRIVIGNSADLEILGAQTALADEYRFKVVGSARWMQDMLLMIDQTIPDVVILSTGIHCADILNTIEQIQVQNPAVKIIVMGELVNGLLIRDLFAVGVNGYLCRSDDLCELLVPAVNTVMRGRPYLSPTANTEYLIAMQSPNANDRLDSEARQVLQLLAHGEHAGQISERLGIDKRRVYWVREKLRRRFGAKTNEHLIQRAAAEGFIYPRD